MSVSATRRAGLRCLVALLALGATTASAASAASPAWHITMTHVNAYGAQGGRDPYAQSAKTFARDSAGNAYTITITNAGTAPMSAPAEFVDQLPPGIVLSGSKLEIKGETSQIETGVEFENACRTEGVSGRVIGASTVRCSTAKTLAPGESFEPIVVNAYVLPDAAPPAQDVGTLTNLATVSGGGAITANTGTEGETTIVPAVPFGFASFTTAVEELESPFETPSPAHPLKRQQQAGGHPFQYGTELLLNYTPDSQGLADVAAGGPKELQVELPPGFVGDLLNTPQCPLHALGGTSVCPADTAIGYVKVRINGPIEGGKAKTNVEKSEPEEESLLWNMAPAAGHVAALGLVIKKGIPFVLEGKVRSGTDYGVTIGDNASSNAPRPWFSQVVTCENGATEEGGGLSRTFHCNPAPAEAKPFLSNPTQCASPLPPVTSAETDSWEGVPGLATTRAYANAPYHNSPIENTSKEPALYSEVNGPPVLGTPTPAKPASEVTGCDKLQFNPTIGFEPSPAPEGGTSQADAPTGITVGLTVPQTNEVKALATPELKDVEMKLPEGMTASPSAAGGLEACSKSEFWPPESGSAPAEEREPAVAAECPPASQIATAEVFTPLLSGAPIVDGSLATGHELTCSSGDWSGGPWSPIAEQTQAGTEVLENGNHERLKLSYEWLGNGKSLTSAREYLVQAGDVASSIQCQVTATRERESTAANPSVAVSRAAVGPNAAPLPPASIAAPSGTLSPEHAVTCERGAWGESPTSFEYDWLKDGVPIESPEAKSGPTTATSFAYTLKTEDEGAVIQCQVTATNTSKEDVLADSAAAVVLPVPSLPPSLPGAALQGQAFQGEPECSPCSPQEAQEGKLLPLFIQLQDPRAGLIIKIHGKTKVNTEPGPEEGRLTSVFTQQPQQPFELFQLKLKGGPRAPLANSQSCGAATTTSVLTPWSASGMAGPPGEEHFVAGTPSATPFSSYNVEGCSNPMSFSPSFNAGTSNTTAGAPTNFSVTFGRGDGQQDLSGVTVHMPPGLAGKIPDVTLCSEAEALAQKEEAPSEQHNRPHCPAASEIGTATSLAGPGPDPYKSVGQVYLTGPIKKGPFPSAPFGLVVDTPAESPAFNLGHVVVLSGITIDENTAAVTATSEALPQFVDGVQLRLREVRVDIHKPGFMFNPTNCNEQHVTGTLGGLQGATANVSSKFGIRGCTNLLFHPVFTATTEAHTSKLSGASLNVKIAYPQGSNYANIGGTVTDLPIQLPSRLETLHKACPDTVFEANPAACPAGSSVGMAIAHVPTLNAPLEGPAILVSHGNRAFPDLEILLQGEGVKVVLDGHTDIKKGVTKTTFESVPDSPVESFELKLPEGSNSVLAAPENLCTPTRVASVKQSVAIRRKGHVVHVMRTVSKRVPEQLLMPTELIGQNGAVIKQNTVIGVAGCPPTVVITTTKRSGNALLVTVKTSAKGKVRLSGVGLKTTVKTLAAGTHQVRVALTGRGRSLQARGKSTKVTVGLTVGKQQVRATVSGVGL